MQPSEKLVMMANQIARNLAIQGDERAITAMTEHIRKFWDARMRATIAKHLATGGKGLTPIALKALEQVGPPAAPCKAG